MRNAARRWAGVLVSSVLLAACGDASQDGDASRLPAAPSDWQAFESSCGYRFRAPSDLREVVVQPIDSCVEQFATDDCLIESDVGRYSFDLGAYASEPEHRSLAIVVDGRPGTAVNFRLANPRDGRAYVAALHVGSIDTNNAETKLNLWAACGSPATRDDIEAIFGTIELTRR